MNQRTTPSQVPTAGQESNHGTLQLPPLDNELLEAQVLVATNHTSHGSLDSYLSRASVLVAPLTVLPVITGMAPMASLNAELLISENRRHACRNTQHGARSANSAQDHRELGLRQYSGGSSSSTSWFSMYSEIVTFDFESEELPPLLAVYPPQM